MSADALPEASRQSCEGGNAWAYSTVVASLASYSMVHGIRLRKWTPYCTSQVNNAAVGHGGSKAADNQMQAADNQMQGRFRRPGGTVWGTLAFPDNVRKRTSGVIVWFHDWS